MSIVVATALLLVGVAAVCQATASVPEEETESFHDRPGHRFGNFGSPAALLVKIFALVVAGPIVIPIIAEGMRKMMPPLSQKLHTLPMPYIHHFKSYEGWSKLDLAFGLSFLLFFTIYWLWLNILRLVAYPEKARGSAAFQSLVFFIGIIVICADAILFYYALSQRSGIFGGGVFSFGALVMTVIYVGIILAFALGAVHLEE